MNWQDELKKEIEAKTLLDFDSLDWKVLTSFIESLLKKQREIDIKIAHKIADDCYNRKMINHKEVDDLYKNEPDVGFREILADNEIRLDEQTVIRIGYDECDINDGVKPNTVLGAGVINKAVEVGGLYLHEINKEFDEISFVVLRIRKGGS